MAKAKKAPRKRKAEYAPHRPVLSVRVKEEMFESISRGAAALNISLTEEVHRRLADWERYMRVLGEVAAFEEKMLHDKEEIIVEVLESRGYTRISGPGGTVWAEPGVKNVTVPTGAAEYHGLEATITAAVERAVAKALKDRKE